MVFRWCHSGAQRVEQGPRAAQGEQGAGPTTAGEADALGSLEAPKRQGFRTALLAGGMMLGPHALCLLGISSGVGVGGFALHSWCNHSTTDLGIPLRKLSVIPEDRVEFSGERAALAQERLLAAEPRFNQVIATKAQEAEGAPIKVVFLHDQTRKEVSVVFCKNGGLCPCSEPELYAVGTLRNLAQPELFPGQHSVLEALFFGK